MSWTEGARITTAPDPVSGYATFNDMVVSIFRLIVAATLEMDSRASNQAAIADGLAKHWEGTGCPSFAIPHNSSDIWAINGAVCRDIKRRHDELCKEFHHAHASAMPPVHLQEQSEVERRATEMILQRPDNAQKLAEQQAIDMILHKLPHQPRVLESTLGLGAGRRILDSTLGIPAQQGQLPVPQISDPLLSKTTNLTNVAGGKNEPNNGPIGFLGSTELADALGVHESRREAFSKRRERERV